jgi:flagellin FlaB
LVLVAAIAAGVLINTAGFLQSQAEATGQESTDQVSNGLQVVTANGSVSALENGNDSPDVTVKLTPGSDPVNLSNTRYQVTGDATNSGTLKDLNGVSQGDTLSEQDDYQEFSISTISIGEGDSVTLTLTTADGSQTTLEINAPNPVNSGSESVQY